MLITIPILLLKAANSTEVNDPLGSLLKNLPTKIEEDLNLIKNNQKQSSDKNRNLNDTNISKVEEDLKEPFDKLNDMVQSLQNESQMLFGDSSNMGETQDVGKTIVRNPNPVDFENHSDSNEIPLLIQANNSQDQSVPDQLITDILNNPKTKREPFGMPKSQDFDEDEISPKLLHHLFDNLNEDQPLQIDSVDPQDYMQIENTQNLYPGNQDQRFADTAQNMHHKGKIHHQEVHSVLTDPLTGDEHHQIDSQTVHHQNTSFVTPGRRNPFGALIDGLFNILNKPHSQNNVTNPEDVPILIRKGGTGAVGKHPSQPSQFNPMFVMKNLFNGGGRTNPDNQSNQSPTDLEDIISRIKENPSRDSRIPFGLNDNDDNHSEGDEILFNSGKHGDSEMSNDDPDLRANDVIDIVGSINTNHLPKNDASLVDPRNDPESLLDNHSPDFNNPNTIEFGTLNSNPLNQPPIFPDNLQIPNIPENGLSSPHNMEFEPIFSNDVHPNDSLDHPISSELQNDNGFHIPKMQPDHEDNLNVDNEMQALHSYLNNEHPTDNTQSINNLSSEDSQDPTVTNPNLFDKDHNMTINKVNESNDDHINEIKKFEINMGDPNDPDSLSFGHFNRMKTDGDINRIPSVRVQQFNNENGQDSPEDLLDSIDNNRDDHEMGSFIPGNRKRSNDDDDEKIPDSFVSVNKKNVNHKQFMSKFKSKKRADGSITDINDLISSLGDDTEDDLNDKRSKSKKKDSSSNPIDDFLLDIMNKTEDHKNPDEISPHSKSDADFYNALKDDSKSHDLTSHEIDDLNFIKTGKKTHYHDNGNYNGFKRTRHKKNTNNGSDISDLDNDSEDIDDDDLRLKLIGMSTSTKKNKKLIKKLLRIRKRRKKILKKKMLKNKLIREKMKNSGITKYLSNKDIETLLDQIENEIIKNSGNKSFDKKLYVKNIIRKTVHNKMVKLIIKRNKKALLRKKIKLKQLERLRKQKMIFKQRIIQKKREINKKREENRKKRIINKKKLINKKNIINNKKITNDKKIINKQKIIQKTKKRENKVVNIQNIIHHIYKKQKKKQKINLKVTIKPLPGKIDGPCEDGCDDQVNKDIQEILKIPAEGEENNIEDTEPKQVNKGNDVSSLERRLKMRNQPNRLFYNGGDDHERRLALSDFNKVLNQMHANKLQI